MCQTKQQYKIQVYEYTDHLIIIVVILDLQQQGLSTYLSQNMPRRARKN